MGPAPATMLPAPERFVFHCSFSVYAVPLVTASMPYTAAALGEKVPANPPLSFHNSG